MTAQIVGWKQGPRNESQPIVVLTDPLIPARPVVPAVERRARRFWPLVGGVAIVAGVVVAAGIEGGAL